MSIKRSLKSILKRIFKFFVLDKEVDNYCHRFYWKNSKRIKHYPFQAVSYMVRLNLAQWRQQTLDSVYLPSCFEKVPPLLPSKSKKQTSKTVNHSGQSKDKKSPTVKFDFNFAVTQRLAREEFEEKIKGFEVISFDIFDTLVFRTVESPEDIFSLVGIKCNCPDFRKWRVEAEKRARIENDYKYGSREITLNDIYRILYRKYSIPSSVMKIEEETELEHLIPNSYMQNLYYVALSEGKKIVLTTDMYLSKASIEKILHNCGYRDYSRIFLSNEYKLRKGDGTLQKKLLEDFPAEKILHIGDSLNGDYEKFIANGISAIHNPSPRVEQRPNFLGENLYASTYQALICNELNSGCWSHDQYFTHGFRVGGLLAFGFCQFVNHIAKTKKVDKILFCARDCFIIDKVYKRYFNNIPSEYLQISRRAIFKVTLDQNFNDFIGRCLLKYYDLYKNRTVQDYFVETGFDFLVPFLEQFDIDKYFYLSNFKKEDIEEFAISNKDVIKLHYEDSKQAAEAYFKKLIGNAKKILVVDIGWSGTCIKAFEDFLRSNVNEQISVYGALMCTSRNRSVTEKIISGQWTSYVYSPVSNMDITREIMPGKTSSEKQDLLHIPLEYIFTAPQPTLLAYSTNGFIYDQIVPPNVEQIHSIQNGILEFCKLYLKYVRDLAGFVPGNTAFSPYRTMLKDLTYIHSIYKDFIYDSVKPISDKNSDYISWHRFMVTQGFYKEEICHSNQILTKDKRRSILFISPEMIYTGAPRSLLRMVNVAIKLGYKPTVWTAVSGPFEKEFQQFGIHVQEVPESELVKLDKKQLASQFGMVVCNTIVTDRYAEYFEDICPVCWYIREATNIPDFITRNEKRRNYLSRSKSIYCVSDYAREAIQKYTQEEVKVIKNCVEDEIDLATDYKAGSGDKVKFIQMGTIEYRKGYDVLFAAYLSMPESYRQRSEVYFAGGLINSAGAYASNLFAKIKNEGGIHYLGLIKGESKKIQTISGMDVVVVASRDESCSLVALEGAMLSKPLIVTENVGAKYMVDNENGYVVETGSVQSLKTAMMKLIDNRTNLYEMGRHSRVIYEQKANMEAYTKELKKLFELSNEKLVESNELIISESNPAQLENVVVSLTSYPARIQFVSSTIQSILKQTVLPKKILLWLYREEFQNIDLPRDLLDLEEANREIFEIRWVNENLKPHKKYFYAAKEFSELAIITIDDDQVYPSNLVETLVLSYMKNPECIHCNRANLMTFREDGTLRPYSRWIMSYRSLLDTPSAQLLPTGVGGVLYPPHCIPQEALDIQGIKDICLHQDDLWLKMWTIKNGYKVVVPRNFVLPQQIDNSQDSALWRLNVYNGGNDINCQKILSFIKDKGVDTGLLLDLIRRDRSLL